MIVTTSRTFADVRFQITITERVFPMILRAHRLIAEPAPTLQACSIDSLPEVWSESPTPCWIDVEADDHANLVQTLAPLQLHPLMLAAMQDLRRGARYLQFERAIYLAIPTRSSWKERRANYVGMLILPQIVATIHYGPIDSLTALTGDLPRHVHPIGTNVSALVYLVLDYLIDRAVDLAPSARDKIENLYWRFEKSPGSTQIQTVTLMKHRVGYLAVNYDDMMHVVVALQTTESAVFRASEHREYFRDLAEHLRYALRTVNRVEQRLRDIQQGHDIQLQERANARLRILTIVSSIFMPLTFICSVYGMNFDNMPETHWRYGYFAVLGLLAVVAIGLSWFFWSRKWFK